MSSASTGGTEGSSPASSPASAASLAMAAPKYGTLVPNRIFVGGISASTSEAELAQLFSAYGNVKATKIISDRAGVSKGYGFVTFETEEEAKRLQQESECIVLRERKLNIAPAIKKQPFNRSFDGGSGSPPAVPTNTYYYTNGMGLTYQNGMTFYNTGAPAPATPVAPPADPATIYQATGVFGPQATAGHQTFTPVMYPCPAPSLYMPQQYQYSPMPYEPYYAGATATGAPQYVYTTSGSQGNTPVTANASGGGNSNTGATSPPTGPPPPLPSLQPPPPTHHFYASAAPSPHHHPSVPSGPLPTQVDHLYYSFATGPPPPPSQHAPIGMADQQLLLYTTDASCQPSPNNDSQVATQESCSNDTDDGNAGPMHCRTIVYHPATVYIPHSHAPPYHPTTTGTSLLPTPPPLSQQTLLDSNAKMQNHASREYSKALPNTFAKSQNLSVALISGAHQSNLGKVQNLNALPKYSAGTVGSPRFPLPHQYHKQNVSSNFRSNNYNANQNSQRRSFGMNSSLNGQNYSCACSGPQKGYAAYDQGRGNASHSPEHLDNRARNAVQKNLSNVQKPVNQGTESQGTPGQNSPYSDSVNSGNPASPPPAPYSPMTRPLPILSPPIPQVQFYAPAQNRYQSPLPPATGQHQQQPSQRRYTVAPPLPAGRKPSDKYSSLGSQNPVLRQPKYKPNGIVQPGVKVPDDSLGGAGDAPQAVGRMPITPPGTPRSHPGEQNQLSDACHQMQALSL